METPNNSTGEVRVFAAEGRRRRLIGVTALVLLFCASASVVFAYLSDVPAVSAGEEASAAAAAAVEAPDPFAGISLGAKAVYVKDLATGAVLYARNPDSQLPLASITKVATVLAASEVISSDTVITIPYDTAPPGSAERLAAGEQWLFRDVVNFTLIASSNGGADIIAAAANAGLHAKYPQAPLSSATIWRMNNLAQQLGLTETYFLNTSGLDISTTLAGSYGSARDIASLFAYAASTSPALFEGTERDNMLFTSINGARTAAYNTDEALGSIPGLVMGKTGYTDLAGGNLAVLFDVGISHPVVAVVLGSTYSGRFDDMKTVVAAARAAVAQEH